MPANEQLPKPGGSTKRAKRTLEERIAAHDQAAAAVVDPRAIYMPAELFALIDTMNSEGGAVLFGTASDRGVLTVVTYLGKSRTAHYIRHRDQWLELFTDLVDSEILPTVGGGEGQEPQT